MRTSLFALLLSVLAGPGFAQTPPASGAALPFTLKPLGHGIYAAIDNSKGEAGANAGFVIGDDAVLVVDTFENVAAAQALLGEIRMLTKLPIKFVVNTHYHLDHVAGNAIFAKDGATIVAHRNDGGAVLGEDGVSRDVVEMVVSVDHELDGQLGEHADFAEQGLGGCDIFKSVHDQHRIVADDEAGVGAG